MCALSLSFHRPDNASVNSTDTVRPRNRLSADARAFTPRGHAAGDRPYNRIALDRVTGHVIGFLPALDTFADQVGSEMSSL